MAAKQGAQGGETPQVKGPVLPLVISVLLLLSLGLSLVWVNMERRNLEYALQGQQRELDARTELHSKLLVERDHLLSPHVLGTKASAMGLHIAKPGQIRRMGEKVSGKQSVE